ncbi:hypothetical protein D9M68_478190 [compost metagenome]
MVVPAGLIFDVLACPFVQDLAKDLTVTVVIDFLKGFKMNVYVKTGVFLLAVLWGPLG